ncbi:hypothetical protein J6X90_00055 [Candidatus Saccharibacteria bacterium]|nr:hypothetical protein [Candidatus Saccharibacteria bacterium]
MKEHAESEVKREKKGFEELLVAILEEFGVEEIDGSVIEEIIERSEDMRRAMKSMSGYLSARNEIYATMLDSEKAALDYLENIVEAQKDRSESNCNCESDCDCDSDRDCDSDCDHLEADALDEILDDEELMRNVIDTLIGYKSTLVTYGDICCFDVYSEEDESAALDDVNESIKLVVYYNNVIETRFRMNHLSAMINYISTHEKHADKYFQGTIEEELNVYRRMYAQCEIRLNELEKSQP